MNAQLINTSGLTVNVKSGDVFEILKEAGSCYQIEINGIKYMISKSRFGNPMNSSPSKTVKTSPKTVPQVDVVDVKIVIDKINNDVNLASSLLRKTVKCKDTGEIGIVYGHKLYLNDSESPSAKITDHIDKYGYCVVVDVVSLKNNKSTNNVIPLVDVEFVPVVNLKLNDGRIIEIIGDSVTVKSGVVNECRLSIKMVKSILEEYNKLHGI